MNNRAASRLAAVGCAAVAMALAATPAHAEKIANSYICVFKNDRVAKDEVAGRANAAARANGGVVRHVYTTAIRGFSANISDAGMNAMRRANAAIAYCEQDQVATAIGAAAKGKPGGSPTPPPAQEKPWGITRVKGGAAGTFKRAWIIDSGIDGGHDDLNVDRLKSKDFTGSRNGWTDENGHGTHVAGTVGAIDNGIGVIGVAPGAPVVAVRVLDRRGSGAYSDVIAGVDHVADIGSTGDVANMSLGGPKSPALDTAVKNAATGGVRFTLAAGNETDDSENHSPARAEGENVYTVAAFGTGDKWASFSNYGSHVDWAEPGVSVKSTYKGNGYATLSGTSMAAPHLAGILLQSDVTQDGLVARTSTDSYKIGVVK